MRPLRCLLILLILLLPTGPFATIFLATKTADTNGSCVPGNCSLREAINGANANPGADDVLVPAGFYLLTLGQLVVSDDVSIAGAGQTTTIIDGNATDRVFEIQTGVAGEISGVTIQNGYCIPPSCDGGGISIRGYLSLIDSTVSDNTAGQGGGISTRGYLSLIDSTVSDNTATRGGGGISGYDFTLTNSTVSGNTRGGGILGHDFTLTNSTVSGNTGSGIRGHDFTLTNSTVSGNTGGSGGGINGNDFTLTNSTVSGNTGSGVWISSSFGYGNVVVTFMNSTVSGNSQLGIYASSYYYCDPAGCTGSPPDLFIYFANSIVAENGAPDGNCSSFVSFLSLGYNLTDDTSCGFTEPSDLVVADAMLGPLQDNGGPTETHDLLPGSPAIDAGSVSCPPPATDQRGIARPQGGGCDIGAVEYLPEPHHAATLIAGAALLALLYRRRARGLEGTIWSGQF